MLDRYLLGTGNERADQFPCAGAMASEQLKGVVMARFDQCLGLRENPFFYFWSMWHSYHPRLPVHGPFRGCELGRLTKNTCCSIGIFGAVWICGEEFMRRVHIFCSASSCIESYRSYY